MSKDSLRIPDYIDHMLQAINRISRYVQGLDESARNIERSFPEFAAQHPEIPWTDIYLMRNRLSHGYFSIDMELVWKTVQRDIPDLEKQLHHLQRDVKDDSSEVKSDRREPRQSTYWHPNKCP